MKATQFAQHLAIACIFSTIILCDECSIQKLFVKA